MVARTSAGDKKVITNNLLLHRDESYCAIYLINHGWRVEGQTFAVDFSSTGEATQFTCSLNGEEFECESGILSQYQQVTAYSVSLPQYPYLSPGASPLVLSDLSPGRYAFMVHPQDCSGYRGWKKVFRIY